jgi:hypothetical protein
MIDIAGLGSSDVCNVLAMDHITSSEFGKQLGVGESKKKRGECKTSQKSVAYFHHPSMYSVKEAVFPCIPAANFRISRKQSNSTP